LNDLYTLTNCTIITVDDKDSFYANGTLIVKNNRIKELGTSERVSPLGKVIDMGGKLIMPGLINTHTHSHSSLFKNQADDMTLMDWLKKAMWPMERFLSKERSFAATSLSCLEYIQGGITCYADQFYFADTTAAAAQSSGLRVFLAPTVFTNPSPETTDTLSAAVDFIEKYHGKQEDTLVYPCIGPHAPYSVSERLWRECAKLSEKYKLIIHTHISETIDENNQIKEQTGMSPTQWLNSMGVLERPVLAAHSIHLDEQDMELYARKNVRVAYNPVSNLKLVSGVMPMKRMREKNILISMGTDGAQSNNSMDLLRDLRTGVLLQKQVNEEATFFTSREAIRMVTINGAKALDMQEQIGSLEVGKRADLIALDTTSPRLCPLHRSSLKNLYSTITYSAIGSDVCDVIVDGKWVMHDKKVLTLNVSDVQKNAQEASEYLVKNANLS